MKGKGKNPLKNPFKRVAFLRIGIKIDTELPILRFFRPWFLAVFSGGRRDEYHF